MIFGGLLRYLREVGLSLLKRAVLGLAAFIGPVSPIIRPIVEREIAVPALDSLREKRLWEITFERSKTKWVASVVPQERWSEWVSRNQMYAADIVLVGPDGQVITIQNLIMPTRQPFDEEAMKRRLAAELKRLEEKKKIQPIGDNPSGYIEKAIVRYDVYLWTITPLRR